MTVLIVDDEPLARSHLRRLLEAQGVQIVGEAENAARALELAEDLRPDLLLLDIQMPGLTGMQMASALLHLEPAPLLIFVTGYSEHAVAAFEHGALDYLMKPVSAERLAKMLVRARERLADASARREAQQWVSERAAEAPPLRRLPVRGDYVVHLIRVEEITCAVARERRVLVRTKGGEYRTYYTLMQLEALLPKEQFLRIHDSCLVNLEEVNELLFLGGHNYEVRLSDNQRLPVGRRRYPELRRRLGLESAPASHLQNLIMLPIFILAATIGVPIQPGVAVANSAAASPALSQEPAGTPAAALGSALPERLAVEQAVRLGLERNPQMAAARAAVVSAERSYRSLAAFPAVNLGVTHVLGSSSGPTLNGLTSDTFLDLGDTLDTSGQRRFQAAAARAQLAVARYQLEETSLTLTQQIRDAYWSLVAARAQALLARESLQDAQKLYHLTTAQYQVGASPRVDTIRSSIDQANAVQSAVSAEGAERTALTGFNVLLARPAPAPVDPADQLTETTVLPAATTPLPPLAELTQRAIAHRPLVLAAQAQVSAARCALKQARAARLPDVAVDYERSVQDPTYTVVLGARLPLLDLGSVRNAIKAAEAARKQAEAQEQQAEQQVVQQVAQAYTDLTQAQVLAASYQTDILSPSGTLLTVAQQGYERGGTGILPVLDAESTLRNARTGYVNSLLALYKAQDELQAATGESPAVIAVAPREH